MRLFKPPDAHEEQFSKLHYQIMAEGEPKDKDYDIPMCNGIAISLKIFDGPLGGILDGAFVQGQFATTRRSCD